MEEKHQIIVENFCKSALKKEEIDIIKLSYVLGCDSQYTVTDIVDWWKELHMNTRLADTPDLSTPEKKIGAWFNLLTAMISRKVAGVPLPELSRSKAPIKLLPAKNDIIQLKDLTKFFEVQLELPSPVFLSQRKFPLDSGENQQKCENDFSISKDVTLQQDGSDTKEIDYSRKTKRAALYKAIHCVSNEVEQLYNGMKSLLKAKGITLSLADERQQTEACKNFYDQNSNQFSFLKQNHIESAIGNSKYWITSNPARDIKGGLYEQYIISDHGFLAADKNLKTNFQDLYSLSKKES